ncbi:MAG: RNA-directed DNA polymerase [Planctomycetia bacterium]|nr:RNA-directed DNA polymerase [Planctomycetia bacterium]
MGLFNWISKLFRRTLPPSVFKYPEPRWDKKELLRRLNLNEINLIYTVRGFNPRDTNLLAPHLIPLGYWWHKIPKRSGKPRMLYSPNPRLKLLQKLLLRKVFAKLAVHSACKGFRRGQSNCTHARLHVGKAVVVRIDIKDFFHSTSGNQVYDFFRRIGWNHEAASLIQAICTRKNRLPQGAPTSPILSNLVNYRMDARLAGLAGKSQAIYSRYADDLIFSFEQDNRRFIRGVIRRVVSILFESGYTINRTKLNVMRQHNRQVVTGLVVNRKVHLPRSTRRWLRSVEHHLNTGKSATLTREQLAGWKAYQQMIQTQSTGN